MKSVGQSLCREITADISKRAVYDKLLKNKLLNTEKLRGRFKSCSEFYYPRCFYH